MKLLITDGENRASLAVTRSLGRKGCRIVVTGNKERTMASCSRHCARGVAVPEPYATGSAYTMAILDIVATEKINAVFPMTEVSINLLNKVRDQLPPGVILACASDNKMAAVSNKVELFKLAEKLDVPAPRTYYLDGPDHLLDIMQEIRNYPVVIKPALSRIPVQGGRFLTGDVRYAASQQELKEIYQTRPVLHYPSMIQERVVGPGTGLFTLYDKDRHLALFSHRRIREKPPSGGVSVVSESVTLDEEMVEHSGKLLSAVGWEGVAMVEFKRDLRDGKAKLMEINGRFWGTLQLAVASGVDFPGLYLDLLQGNRYTSAIRNYRVGHKLKWFFGTLDHLYIRLKNRDETQNLPPGSPTKWQALLDFLNIWEKNTSFDVFDHHDIGPFLFEAKNYLRRR